MCNHLQHSLQTTALHCTALLHWDTIEALINFISFGKISSVIQFHFSSLLPGSGVTFPWGFEVGVDLCDGFFPLSSFFLPLEELSDPGDFLPSIPFSRGEWWFPLVAAPLSLASSTTRSWSSFSPSLLSMLSLFSFLWSGDPPLGLSPGLRELLWKYQIGFRTSVGLVQNKLFLISLDVSVQINI